MAPHVASFYNVLNSMTNKSKLTNHPKVLKLSKAKSRHPEKKTDSRRKRKCPDCSVEFISISSLYFHATTSHYFQEIANNLSDEFVQVSISPTFYEELSRTKEFCTAFLKLIVWVY